MNDVIQATGIGRLVEIIESYESDTFNAQDLGSDEAAAMALRLFDRFCRILSEGGTIICDGVMLSHLLDEVRERDHRNG